jgi:hypothetical protein
VDLTNHAKPYTLWLPPLLAFAGLTLLLVLGRASWVYSLPYGQGNSQVLTIKTSLLRGVAGVPESVHVGTALVATGWLGSVDPSLQPQEITLSLDGKPVAATSAFHPVSISANGQTATIQRWQMDFFVKDMLPGKHNLALQAAIPGHEPVALAQTTISILP